MYQVTKPHIVLFGGVVLALAGCNIQIDMEEEPLVDSDMEQTANGGRDNPDQAANQTPSGVDNQLNELITTFNLNNHPQRDVPSIEEPLAQLGKKLFFTKSLGGDFDSACVTCHHPALGGADDLSLPIGVGATNEDLLGQGRVHHDGLPLVPRNAPTVFNMALWDRGLFHDSRVETLNFVRGSNGSNGDIRTPDSAFDTADNQAGVNLVTAQARFPVTSVEEMRGETFEAGNTNNDVRNHLASRLGNYGEGVNALVQNTWLSEFQTAFGSNDSAENIVTYDNIAFAIAEYERSMTFVNHPWQQYMDGDLSAISNDAKQGALLFFTGPEQGGAGCAACHNGQLFSDEQHHVVAFPQIGPGKGDGNSGDDDFGRERETGDSIDRYRFRTASLLNLTVSAPYSHSGSYDSLEQVVRHYINPDRAVEDYFEERGRRGEQRNGICRLDQFETIQDCQELYPNAFSNSQAAVTKLQQEQNSGTSRLARGIRLNDTQVDQLVAFLEALTDPCVEDRDCLAPWIPAESEAADEHQLNAINRTGNAL